MYYVAWPRAAGLRAPAVIRFSGLAYTFHQIAVADLSLLKALLAVFCEAFQERETTPGPVVRGPVVPCEQPPVRSCPGSCRKTTPGLPGVAG